MVHIVLGNFVPWEVAEFTFDVEVPSYFSHSVQGPGMAFRGDPRIFLAVLLGYFGVAVI